MGDSRIQSRRRGSVVLLVLLVTAVLAALGKPASADVSAVKGTAYGYTASVSLFGGPPGTRGVGQFPCTSTTPPPPVPAGCAPTPALSDSPEVSIPGSGGNQSQTDAEGPTAQYGPAIIFSSGQQVVSTQGTTGAGGSVTSTASFQNVNKSGQEVFTASALESTCSASEAGGATGSTTVTGGVVQTSEGNPDVDGDEVNVNVPTNPAPNTSIPGVIEGVGDSFNYIFNEQVVNPDGSITVYAAHLDLLGPTAVGDLYIGRVECGVTAGAPPTTGTGPTTTGVGPTTTGVGPTTTGVNPTTTAVAPTSTTAGANTTTTGGDGGGGVNAVSGGAYGYFTSVGLFGGPKNDRGPEPVVELPASGSATPITKSLPEATAQYGPATIFSSGPLEVSTEGTTGANGSVKSSTKVQGINRSESEVLTISEATSSCTADATGENSTVRITGGRLETSRGNPDVDGDSTFVDLPVDPAPNTSFNGTLEDVGDNFRVVLNEIQTGDGSITVNAVHMFLLGPTAVGDLIIGQSRCATTATGGGGGPNAGGGGTGTGSTAGTTAKTGADVSRWLQLALALVAIGGAIHWTGRRRLPGADHPPGLP